MAIFIIVIVIVIIIIITIIITIWSARTQIRTTVHFAQQKLYVPPI